MKKVYEEEIGKHQFTRIALDKALKLSEILMKEV